MSHTCKAFRAVPWHIVSFNELVLRKYLLNKQVVFVFIQAVFLAAGL